MITSTKGLTIHMEKESTTTLDLVPKGITKAKPSEVTVDDTTGMVDGQLVTFSGTNYPELDGKIFVVDKLTSTTFELLGSDLTASTGTTIGGAAKAMAYNAADVVTLCLSSIDISPGSPNTIDISTFCTPGASLPGNPTPGTMTFNGFTDIASKGYAELLAAEADGKARLLKIDVPNNGYLIGKVTVGSVSWGVPLEGSTTYSFAATMSTPMRHVF